MAITAFIAHRISRTQPDASISLQLLDNSITLSGEMEEMAYQLKTQLIRKGGKSYGRFTDDIGAAPFSSWLKDYREERLSFASFTQKTMSQLKQLIDTTPALIDGYCFFVEEKIESGDFYSIYIIEHLSGHYLDSNLELSPSLHLDLNNFTLAAKINCAEWQANDSTTYLTLMRSRGDKDISEAFGDWLGFTDKADLKKETHQFLAAVESFTQTLEEPVARLTKTKVANYCLEQNKAGKPVVIEELADSLSQETKSYEPKVFSDFIQKAEPSIKEELIPHAGEVRSFVRISGRNDNLSMSFASECLGGDIEYDFERDLLMIRNIPSSLKKQLLSHLKQKAKE
jgi:nucleoid-associated protein